MLTYWCSSQEPNPGHLLGRQYVKSTLCLFYFYIFSCTSVLPPFGHTITSCTHTCPPTHTRSFLEKVHFKDGSVILMVKGGWAIFWSAEWLPVGILRREDLPRSTLDRCSEHWSWEDFLSPISSQVTEWVCHVTMHSLYLYRRRCKNIF